MTKQWLSLSEYSKKYDVSVSTLRRRIKQLACEFVFEEGRYELRDRPLEEHETTSQQKAIDLSAPPQDQTGLKSTYQPTHLAAVPSLGSVRERFSAPQPTNKPPDVVQAPAAESRPSSQSSVLDPSVLVAELKKAYSMILSEKEEQIVTLKEEVADLRTLVRVLEESNQQLKTSLDESRSIDAWLSSLDK